MPTRYDVLIIGGGFSGTILACQLSRCCGRELAVALIERKGLPGRGVAYGPQCFEHLLNVPASNMSAFPDSPSHFVQWLGKNYPAWADPNGFVPRKLFGQYVGELLDLALIDKNLRLQWIEEEAISLRRDRQHTLVVSLLSGLELEARCVILATGNFPPANPEPFAQEESHRFLRFAWSNDALEGLPDRGSVLLLGSGLTALDQVLALHAAGFAGRIVMLSRRGLMPAMHHVGKAWPADWTQSLPATTRGLLKAVRREVKRALLCSADWRDVIDSMRKNSQETWQALPLEERKRFLRHVRAYWEVHRHRYPSQVDHVLKELQSGKRLTVIAARVLDCRCGHDSAEVGYRDRFTGEKATLRVDRIVNCTGPETDFRRMQDPLTRSLISHRLGRPDALSLGIDVAENGALLDADGAISSDLFAIGPLRKGCLWETTAVPEIRNQAMSLARHLAADFEADSCKSKTTGF